MPADILVFKGPTWYLSNFYPSPFMWGGILWYHSEGAYQAAKSIDRNEVMAIARMCNPGDAKRAGRRVKCRPNWDDIKYDVMYDIVEAKFTQHKVLMDKLVATYPAHLEEGNNHRDTVWGVCPPESGIGRNWLGQILMDIRDHEVKRRSQ